MSPKSFSPSSARRMVSKRSEDSSGDEGWEGGGEEGFAGDGGRGWGGGVVALLEGGALMFVGDGGVCQGECVSGLGEGNGIMCYQWLWSCRPGW